MKSDLDSSNSNGRRSFIEAVKTPLGFFSLIMLIVEALIVQILIATNGNFDKSILFYGVVGIPVLLIIVVGGIAVWKPEALWGKRYSDFDKSCAVRLAEDLYPALDPNLAHLPANQRYNLLKQLLISSHSIQSKAEKNFREWFFKTIVRRAEFEDEWPKRKPKTRL